ncbi:MAG: protein yceI precursor, partial [Candidatus Rokuibacteriota bacterium]
KADITIETRSVNTRIQKRDDDLRSDNFLNAEKFPSITFKSKRVQNVKPDGFELVGDLTIRDVTREVVLKVEGPSAPIKDPQGNRRVGANAVTTINRKDFNVNWNRVIEAGGVVVGDDVKINLEIEAVEKKA